ncbi:hypothetical protein ACQP2C_02905 [Micromonospora zamorensis]|uniref:hypothetical protein n=1 Tax=Micromonospora zamorensis TaxID=709883 RepID=UPI003D95760C
MLVFVAMISASCSPSPNGRGADEGGKLLLSSDGFGIADFGDSIEQVQERLEDRWGPSEGDEFVCESSRTSRMLKWDGVLLVFSSEGLIGYVFGPRAADPIIPVSKDVARAVTADGLHVGDKVKTAREVYGSIFVLREASLGPEWYLDEDHDNSLRGFASGLTDADTIVKIGAGDICAVR